MALDNNYIYLTIVVITTMLIHSNPRTIYHYYIMNFPDFSEENIIKRFDFKISNIYIFSANSRKS